jgi:hypothetical protein
VQCSYEIAPAGKKINGGFDEENIDGIHDHVAFFASVFRTGEGAAPAVLSVHQTDAGAELQANHSSEAGKEWYTIHRLVPYATE